MNKAYLLTGGNLGNRLYNLEMARELISESCGSIAGQSSVYETAAWGPVAQPDYLNQVLEVNTALPPQNLMQTLLGIEKHLGRHREEKYGARTLDIDILYYNDFIVDEENLIIPHPRLYTRRFVLVPLCEIAPGLVHPILQLTTSQLLEQCRDPLNVKKYIVADDGD